VRFGLSFLRMTFNLKADAQPGRGQKKESTPSTRGRGHATEQDCKSETGTVQLRMNPMPLPLRHGRARGACRPRGIMSGSRRPPCRFTAYCQSRANAGQTVRSPQAQDHNRGEKRWNASEGDHPRHREPFPISPRIRQDPQGQRSRSAPLPSNQARKYRIPPKPKRYLLYAILCIHPQSYDIVHPVSPTQSMAPAQSSMSTLH